MSVATGPPVIPCACRSAVQNSGECTSFGSGMRGPSNFVPRFVNSVIIAFGSTALSVALGTLAAYAFSRFKMPLKDDLLFFILSTRMMPPIAVAIPIRAPPTAAAKNTTGK